MIIVIVFRDCHMLFLNLIVNCSSKNSKIIIKPKPNSLFPASIFFHSTLLFYVVLLPILHNLFTVQGNWNLLTTMEHSNLEPNH